MRDDETEQQKIKFEKMLNKKDSEIYNLKNVHE